MAKRKTCRVTLEKDIEGPVVEAMRETTIPIKLHDTGIPDRMFIGPGGRVVFLEFKRFGETPNPHQVRYHKTLRSLGHTVFVFDRDPKQIVKELKEFFE